MKTFKKGGIHPAADKLTSEIPISYAPIPDELVVILRESIGAKPTCVVKAGDMLKKGDLIGEATGFVSSNIHSPVAGKVKRLDRIRNLQGEWQDAVVIEKIDSDEENTAGIPFEEALKLPAKEIIDLVYKNGIVGLGGATFPTQVKLSVPPGKKAEIVIINGAECEPFLTCDDRLMREYARDIVRGTLLLMKAAEVDKAIIGIEENKPQAIEAMKRATVSYKNIQIVELRKKYPQGSEKQLIEACIGKEVPEGGLPVDVGAIVDNVATAYSVYDAIVNGNPLTGRVVTVTGKYVKNPGNFYAVLGTPVSALIELAGGIPENTGKIVAGGPMMGKAVSCPDAPVTKGLSGILLISEEETERKTAGPCIRCAKCVEVCPMGLEPYLLMALGQNSMWDETISNHIMSCLECGSCSYICPAKRPILDYIRLGKIEARKH